MIKKKIRLDVFWREVRQRKLLFSVRWILLIFVLGLSHKYLANDKALIAKVEGKWYFPVTEQGLAKMGLNDRYKKIQRIKWSRHKEFKLMPLVPYTARGLDLKNKNFEGPFAKQQLSSQRYRHWLGTDKLGRDVLAGLLSGCRLVFYICLIVGLFTGVLGLLIGGYSGLLGDDGLSWPLVKLIYYLLCSLLFTYVFVTGLNQYLVIKQGLEVKDAVLILSFLLLIVQGVRYSYRYIVHPLVGSRFAWAIKIPVDSSYYFLTIVLSALPVIAILLAILSNFESPDFSITMIILSMFLWIGNARLLRGEVLRLREMNFIQASRLMGLTQNQIFWRHIYPNIRQQLFVNLSLTLSSAIIVEASLSFLGIGMEAGEISWGVLLQAGRTNLEAWWISLFPGMLLVLTVYSFNRIAEGLKKES